MTYHVRVKASIVYYSNCPEATMYTYYYFDLAKTVLADRYVAAERRRYMGRR